MLEIDDLKEIGFKHIGGKLLQDVGQLFVLKNISFICITIIN